MNTLAIIARKMFKENLSCLKLLLEKIAIKQHENHDEESLCVSFTYNYRCKHTRVKPFIRYKHQNVMMDIYYHYKLSTKYGRYAIVIIIIEYNIIKK